VNLAGLIALLGAVLYINQFREGLIEARINSLFTQGEIISAAIAASATIQTDMISIEPDKLLTLQSGQTIIPEEDDMEFSINPVEIAPLLRKLVTPTKTRARIFDQDGELLVDTATMYSRGEISKLELPPPSAKDTPFLDRVWNEMKLFFYGDASTNKDDLGSPHGRDFPEVRRAYEGMTSNAVNFNRGGQTIVSVAVPVQRSRMVRGVLLLSTLGGDIDSVIRAERLSLVRIFGIAAGIMVIISALFAGTIVEPIRRLSAAADRVRRGVKTREEIPDFTNRADEIGDLSRSLRDMTRVLYDRIEAIESFAADVAHELKNPLTSLRSAVETWPLAKTDDSRRRLLDVIQHDVKRLDRLISDISNASRLDAEMARVDVKPVDLIRLCETVIDVANGMSLYEDVKTVLAFDKSKMKRKDYRVLGQDTRLGQVLTNLIVNAKSFSEPGSEVRVHLTRNGMDIEIVVEDSGPGIPDHALEKIFQRFYTDRPNEGFGQNSGLGLSISRQIIYAHHGKIWAENRYRDGQHIDEAQPIGAKFIIRLPAEA
jgi:two-component system sensor histidine kinase ChvG